jgi:hypothetical protein
VNNKVISGAGDTVAVVVGVTVAVGVTLAVLTGSNSGASSVFESMTNGNDCLCCVAVGKDAITLESGNDRVETGGMAVAGSTHPLTINPIISVVATNKRSCLEYLNVFLMSLN